MYAATVVRKPRGGFLMTADSQGARLGYIWLQPGYTRINGLTLLFACLTGIPFLVIINFVQPFILTEMLNLPQDQQGSVSGYLAIMHEIIVLVTVSPIGALSDRVGRRRILGAGYILTAIGLMAYPFAGTALGLSLIRCVYALGASAIVATYSITLADYPQEKSRGKLVALGAVLNGLGILVLTAIGGNLPVWLTAAGYSAIDAGRLAMALVGAACIASGIIVARGLKGNDQGRSGASKQRFMELLGLGFGAARNPRIAVSYASAFAARGDVVVIGTYVSLWGTQAGMAQGMTAAEGLAKATIVFAVIQTAALLVSPLIGIMNDRIDRVTALVIGMGLAAAGYLLFGLQDSPFGNSSMVIAFVLGIGQVSAILAGTTLVGQEADPKITGATLGVWSFCGALGTMMGSLLGGLLFDFWMPGAPFLFMGIANLLVMIAAIYVRIKYPTDPALSIS
jgi:MFS family permease